MAGHLLSKSAKVKSSGDGMRGVSTFIVELIK